MIVQSGRFGASRNAGESRIAGQQLLSRLPHIKIGLNSEHPIAVFQQHAGQDTGARSNVGEDGTRLKPAFGLK